MERKRKPIVILWTAKEIDEVIVCCVPERFEGMMCDMRCNIWHSECAFKLNEIQVFRYFLAKIEIITNSKSFSWNIFHFSAVILLKFFNRIMYFCTSVQWTVTLTIFLLMKNGKFSNSFGCSCFKNSLLLKIRASNQIHNNSLNGILYQLYIICSSFR